MPEKAIIIIIAHKEHLSEAEEDSLRQCYKILGRYRIVLICPEKLNVAVYKNINANAEIEFIDPKWQSNYRMFNRLKIEPLLYEKYDMYQYMLFYELDAWLFRDELEYWCNSGYDYIGAPWIEQMKNDVPEFCPVGGNGGFSLRNIPSHLRVLRTWKIRSSPKEAWLYYRSFHNFFNTLLRIPLVIRRMLGYENNTRYYIKNFINNEDVFWSIKAKNIDPKFKVAPPEIALKFSFEQHPSALYHLNNNKLPFGCHAWERYEPEFWQKNIKKI